MYKALLVGVAVGLSACAKSPTAPSAPLLEPSSVMALSSATTNCDPPPHGAVQFDKVQAGRVTVTNQSRCTNDFTFMVWRVVDVHSHDPSTQIPQAQQGVTLAPDETRILTVGFSMQCGTSYQRDVYFGVKPKASDALLTYSDIANLTFYAVGGPYWLEPCQAPTVPIPAPQPPPVETLPTPPAPTPPSLPPLPTPPVPPVFLTDCRAGITNYSLVVSGGQGVAIFTVRPGYQIGVTLRSFQKLPSGAFLPQALFDSHEDTVGAGTYVWSITLPPFGPWQGDLYCGLWPREALTAANFAAYDAAALTWIWKDAMTVERRHP